MFRVGDWAARSDVIDAVGILKFDGEIALDLGRVARQFFELFRFPVFSGRRLFAAAARALEFRSCRAGKRAR